MNSPNTECDNALGRSNSTANAGAGIGRVRVQVGDADGARTHAVRSSTDLDISSIPDNAKLLTNEPTGRRRH